MTRQFSMPTVLRMVPNELLKEFFDVTGHSDFDPRWPDLKEREIEPVLDFLSELPLQDVNAIEGALRSIFELACESGANSFLEVAPHCGLTDMGVIVPEDLGEYGRAMWVWLNHRQLFEKAQIIHKVDNLTWWRKRKDLPTSNPDCTEAALERLEHEIS